MRHSRAPDPTSNSFRRALGDARPASDVVENLGTPSSDVVRNPVAGLWETEALILKPASLTGSGVSRPAVAI
jgi:hypothetical protein